MSQIRKNLLIGLPSTGKTTFIAALFDIVERGEVEGSLRLHRLVGDQQHLIAIRNEWLGCRPVPRTGLGAEQMVSFLLCEPSGAETTELVLPDMSGESFRHQWCERQWTAAYESLVNECSGGLLFVHPDRIAEPVRIDMADDLAEELVGEDDVADQVQTTGIESPEWVPENAPTQVQLVELLQFVLSRPHMSCPFRIAVIVAAWDRVAGLGQSPDQWLASRLPMLHQFLTTMRTRLPSRVYGVSSTGGDISTQAAWLLKVQPPERVQVVGVGVHNPHDITEPIRWLMGSDEY